MTDNFSHYHITVDRDVFGTTELFEKVTSPESLEITHTPTGLQVQGMPMENFKEDVVPGLAEADRWLQAADGHGIAQVLEQSR